MDLYGKDAHEFFKKKKDNIFEVVKNNKLMYKIFPKGNQKEPKKKDKIIFDDEKYIRYSVINFLLKFFIFSKMIGNEEKYLKSVKKYKKVKKVVKLLGPADIVLMLREKA